MAQIDYKGILVNSPAPTGPSPRMLELDLKELADRVGPHLEAAFDPGVNDDDSNTGGNGTFYTYSPWINTVSGHIWICIDNSTGAAVWKDITSVETDPVFLAALDVDDTLSANDDSKVASQKAVKGYVDGLVAASDAVLYKGAIDCSGNPNYPAADAGNLYRVSVAGKIGGASGVNVVEGDTLICKTDSTASGNQVAVGSNWDVIQANVSGEVIGPASSVNNHIPQFDGTTGTLLKDGLALDTDSTLVSNSDVRLPSQKAVKIYVDAKGVTVDSGWTANADGGSKTVSIGATATLSTIATALDLVTSGAGTQLKNIGEKVKAIEIALASRLTPNA